jgi:WD40 repeat protein
VILDEPLIESSQLSVDPAGKFVVVTGRNRVFVVPLEGGPFRELQGDYSASSGLHVAVDPGGRLVAVAPRYAPSEEEVIRIWDLESGESWTLGPLESARDEGAFSHLAFMPGGRILSDGVSGLHLWSVEQGHLKTLSQDGGSTSVVTRDGRFALRSEAVALGKPLRLVWYDLEKEVSKVLTSHGTDVFHPRLDPSGRLALGAGPDGILRVGPVTGKEPHLLFASDTVGRVAVSPDGRWIALGGNDGTIQLWPMPDVDEPPFHTLPYEELLDRLRNVTNVRVVENEASSTGYRIDYAPFPGWEKVPEW